MSSREQEALREVVRDFARQHAAPRKGHDPTTWKRLSGELGLTGLTVTERFGGAGATFAEVAVVLEEFGRMLLAEPYLSTAVVATVLAEHDDVAPGLADGSLVGALALTGDVTVDARGRLSGRARYVVDGPYADVLLVRAGDHLHAVRAADAKVTPVATLDLTRRQATVVFADSPAGRVDAEPQRAEDLMRAALAVESAGAAAECLDRTVDYLKTRVQFGRPIGSFQALKHRCADLAVAVEAARATAYAAVAAYDDPAEFAITAPLAKLYCADVFRHVAAEMIQLHGGIGFTWEHDAHLYLKRAKSTELLYGLPAELRRLVGYRAGLLTSASPTSRG